MVAWILQPAINLICAMRILAGLASSMADVLDSNFSKLEVDTP